MTGQEPDQAEDAKCLFGMLVWGQERAVGAGVEDDWYAWIEQDSGSGLPASLGNLDSARSLFQTTAGFIKAWPEVVPEDLVCVLFGCDVPLILRELDDHYIVIGEQSRCSREES
jgi:hypothetical protein